MPQIIIYLDVKEDDIIIHYSKKWNLSKMETIKEIVKRFEEKE